jgi:HlyD family secretion protein
MKSLALALVATLLLGACTAPPDAALGTLERDRISLPAPVSERIVAIPVREGDTVQAGDTVLELEPQRTAARLDIARAEVARQQAVLDEARRGARTERIDEARHRLERARSLALNARKERERIEAVVARGVLPRAERDRSVAASDAADAEVRAAQSVLAELQHGTRPETIAQAEAALAAAQAAVASASVDAERTRIAAPRAGVVDSLPFEVGDQLPIGTPLAVLLVGDVPFARVYVPQPLRAGVEVGSAARVFVLGSDTPLPGRVRSIRAEASFTPYYALSGEDAAHLSYLAEIELDAQVARLPLGVPVRVEFAPADTP